MYFVAFPVDAAPDRLVNLNNVRRLHAVPGDGETVVTLVNGDFFNSLMLFTALKNQLFRADNWKLYTAFVGGFDVDDGITERLFNMDFIREIYPIGDEDAHSKLIDDDSAEFKIVPAYADVISQLAQFTAGKDAIGNSLA